MVDEPNPQDSNGLSGERSGPVLAALAVAADVRPGAQVLVARKGKTAYECVLGFADRERNTPLASNTIYRIGSKRQPWAHRAVYTQFCHRALRDAADWRRWL